MKTIKFKRQTECYGRNGFMKQTGIEVGETYDNLLQVMVTNSRGPSDSILLRLPKEHIYDLVAVLLTYIDQYGEDTKDIPAVLKIEKGIAPEMVINDIAEMFDHVDYSACILTV